MNGQLNGRFTSPNYPSNYGSNERCSLLIEAPRGHYIYLQFRSFHLEYASSCNYDYLEVFDGNSAWSPKITRACGQRYQAPCEIHSSGRFLYVKFRSDGSVQYSGFSAYYYAVSKSKRITFNKLTSVFHASVLLLIMSLLKTLSTWRWIHEARAE